MRADGNPLAALLGDPDTFQPPTSRVPARYAATTGYGPHRTTTWEPQAHAVPAPPGRPLYVAKALQSMGVHLIPATTSWQQQFDELSVDSALQQLDVLDIGLVEVVRMLSQIKATKTTALLLEQIRLNQKLLLRRLENELSFRASRTGAPDAEPPASKEADTAAVVPPVTRRSSLVGVGSPHSIGRIFEGSGANGQTDSDRTAVNTAIARAARGVAKPKPKPTLTVGRSLDEELGSVDEDSDRTSQVSLVSSSRARASSARTDSSPRGHFSSERLRNEETASPYARALEGSYATLAMQEMRQLVARSAGAAHGRFGGGGGRAMAPRDADARAKEVLGSRPRDPLELGMSEEEWKEEQALAARRFVNARIVKKADLERQARRSASRALRRQPPESCVECLSTALCTDGGIVHRLPRPTRARIRPHRWWRRGTQLPRMWARTPSSRRRSTSAR